MKTIACFASSLDGKITPGGGDYQSRFGSKADLHHLLSVRDTADAILMGSGTLMGWPRVHKGHSGKTFVHAILTHYFNFPPDLPLFQHTDVPIVIFFPSPPSDDFRRQFPPHIQWVLINPHDPTEGIRKHLETMGVQTLLVEGGGKVLDLYFQRQAVDELYLTLCPFFFGDKDVTSLVSGHGYPLTDATRAEILNLTQRDNEIYLHLKLHYPAG